MQSDRKTKIVCTLGPATETYEAVERLAELGMNVARINLSHGPLKSHEHKLKHVAAVNEKRKEKVALLLDTRGPEIRTGRAARPVTLVEGAEITLVSGDAECTDKKLSMTYPGIEKVVAPQGRIYLADGNLELEVREVRKKDVLCRVNVGGILGSNKNVCIPNATLELPALSKADLADIRDGITWGFDFVAQSFVRSPEDILELMEFLHENGSDGQIIAKIELASAVEQLDRIIAAGDGIMVARGDLGVQLPIEKIPSVQKLIVRRCNEAGKPVIVATHMLESMTQNPRPTRAEATDVANAVYDGADAVMLSGETAAGTHPFKAVQVMDLICREAEAVHEAMRERAKTEPFIKPTIAEAVSKYACAIANSVEAEAIITPTSKGFTARAVSKQRPWCRIIALTPDERVAKKLSVYWGVHALTYKANVKDEAAMERAVDEARGSGLVHEGSTVVVTAGIPLGLSGSTNTVHVQRVGSPKR